MDEAHAQWAIQRPLRDAARKARKLVYPIPTNQLEVYHKTIKDVEVKLKSSPSPAMPVVATSTPGSELAELASEAGVCTAPGDADAFADALRRLIVDPGQRLMAGKRARKLGPRVIQSPAARSPRPATMASINANSPSIELTAPDWQPLQWSARLEPDDPKHRSRTCVHPGPQRFWSTPRTH